MFLTEGVLGYSRPSNDHPANLVDWNSGRKTNNERVEGWDQESKIFGGNDVGGWSDYHTSVCSVETKPDWLYRMLSEEGMIDSSRELTERGRNFLGKKTMADTELNISNLAAELEWYDFSSKTWTKSRFSVGGSELNSDGMFQYVFRFPRQLTSNHPDYGASPSWGLSGDAGGTAWAYPDITWRKDGEWLDTPDLRFLQIGHESELARNQLVEADMYFKEKTTFNLAFIDCTYLGTDGSKSLANGTVKSDSVCLYPGLKRLSVADPDSFVYVTNNGIERLYFKDGDLAPPKRDDPESGYIVIFGRALDKLSEVIISTEQQSRGSSHCGKA